MAKKLENMDAEEFSAHIAKLDDDAFMEAWTEYGEKVAESRKRLSEFSQEHQKRVRLQQLRDQGFTAADLELLQSVDVETIESGEAVGEQPADADTYDDTDVDTDEETE